MALQYYRITTDPSSFDQVSDNVAQMFAERKRATEWRDSGGEYHPEATEVSHSIQVILNCRVTLTLALGYSWNKKSRGHGHVSFCVLGCPPLDYIFLESKVFGDDKDVVNRICRPFTGGPLADRTRPRTRDSHGQLWGCSRLPSDSPRNVHHLRTSSLRDLARVPYVFFH